MISTSQIPSEPPGFQNLARHFVDGCHVLHHHGILDAYGHLSFRHAAHADIFYMSRAVAPALVSSKKDIIAYWVADGEPLEPTSSKGFVERLIHSEIYKRHPGVQAVVHSHSESVIPYTISSVPLVACYHMAGFLGSRGVTNFDVGRHVGSGQSADLLVRTPTVASSLAACFDNDSANVVLMRGHGFTTVATSIEMAVLRAIYTQKNAAIQTASLGLSTSQRLQNLPADLGFLNERECLVADEMTAKTVRRPWELWVEEVRWHGLYKNEILPQKETELSSKG